MGTNYYWYKVPPCPCCGREYESLHIGKSSAGWCFSLHIYPEQDLNTLSKWKRLWKLPGSYIKDEYGAHITVSQMLDIITKRSRQGPLPDRQWLEKNYAVPGPNNLARRKISHNCVGYGKGTWDYCVGDFS